MYSRQPLDDVTLISTEMAALLLAYGVGRKLKQG